MESADVEQTSGFGSVTHEGITVQSNDETADQIRTALAIEPEVAAKVAPAQPGPDETSERNGDGTFKKRNRRDDPQEAVKAAITRQREAERRAEDAERRLAAQASPRADAAPPSPPAQPTTQAEYARFKAMPGYPKSEDFTDFDDMMLARQVFVDQVLRKEDSGRARDEYERQREEHETRTVNDGWMTRLNEARAKDPDRIAAIDPQTPMSQPMMHVVKVSPVGVELLHYLSEHQDESQRLSTLHPQDALREMGKLEARLEAASHGGPAPVVPIISNAKAPIKPLETSHVTAHDGPPGDDATDEEYFAYKQRQKKAGKR